MDFTVVLAATFVVVTLLGVITLWPRIARWRQPLRTVVLTPESSPTTPICCGTCDFFSLEAGQNELKQNPAFMAAAAVLAPWRMTHKRQFDWHPDFAALDQQLTAAIAAKDTPRVNELNQKINELPLERFGRERPPQSYVPRDTLTVKWEDFGLCSAHDELRSRTDKCDRYKIRLPIVDEAAA